MYQITGQWKKLSQKSSTQWVSSIILAILIHCLLLIMFRPVVPGVAKEYSELSSIRVLDLGASSEIQLLQWLDNHDPARLLRPDPESGYSQTIKYTTFHEKPADLQPPPLTGIPYSEAAPAARINLTPRELVYTPGNEWPLSRLNTIVPNGIQACFNDSALPELSSLLNEAAANASELPRKSSSVTVLRVHSTRMEDQRQDLELIQSCGIRQLDALALQTAKRFFLRYNGQFTAGELAIVWKVNPSGVQGDKK